MTGDGDGKPMTVMGTYDSDGNTVTVMGTSHNLK